MDRAPDADAPATTRLAPPGGDDRRLRVAIAAVGLGLALAVLKPWSFLPATPAGPEGASPPPAGPGAAGPASPRPTPWTGIGDQLACFASGAWTVVIDELDGGRIARSWTRIEPGPADGPADPGIARLHAYADAVPRIGFCTPAGSAAGPTATPRVDLWRLDPGEAGMALFAPVEHRVVTDHTAAAGGMLLAPAGPPASREPTRSSRASWPSGTYVFRVRLPGDGPDAAGGTWFAVDLRGPWPGPDASPTRGRTPGPTADPAPAAQPAPTAPG